MADRDGRDGSVKIGVELDTSQAEQDLKEFEKSVEKTTEKTGKLQKILDKVSGAKVFHQSVKESLADVTDKVHSTTNAFLDLFRINKDVAEEKPFENIDKEAEKATESIKDVGEATQTIEDFTFDNFDATSATSQLMSLQNRMEKLKYKSAELMEELQRLESQRIPTAEYTEIQKAIDKTRDKLNALNDRMEKFVETGGKVKSASFVRMQYDAEQLKNTLESLKKDLTFEEQKGAFIDPATTQRYADLQQKIRETNAEMAILQKRAEEVAEKNKKIGNTAKEIKKVGTAAKKTTNIFEQFTKRVVGLAKRIFIFSLIAKAFRSMVSGIKEGIQNFAKYSDNFNAVMSEFKTSAGQLKNTLGVAFAPILNMIVPALSTLISWLNSAITAINAFVAAISGKTTFTRAKKNQLDYAKSLEKTAGSAKKAESALAAFDDLDVLQTDKGGGAGGAAADVGDMFEEVQIPEDTVSAVERLKDAFKPILDEGKKLADLFKKGFTAGLGDFQSRIDEIKKDAESLLSILQDIATDENVVSSFNNMAEKAAYALGQIVGSLASIGITVAQMVIGGLEDYFSNNSQRVKDYLISMFDIKAEVIEVIGNMFEAMAYVFEAFGTENGQKLFSNLFGAAADAFMGISELLSKFQRDTIELFATPFLDNTELIRQALEGTIGVLTLFAGQVKTVIDSVVDTLNKAYDSHIKPVFDSLSAGLSELASFALTAYTNNFLPFLQGIVQNLQPLIDMFTPFFESLISYIGILTEILGVLWENILLPFFEWIVANLFAQLTIGIDAIITRVQAILTLGMLVFTTITKLANTFLQFFKTAFTKGLTAAFNEFSVNWAKTWEDIKKVATLAANSIIGVVNNIIGGFETMINTIIDGLNKIIEAARSVAEFLNVPFNIKNFDHVSFGRIEPIALANGGITTGETLARIGEAGKEAVLPLENNTEWMDVFFDRMGERAGAPATVILELDGKEMARTELPYFNAESARIGLKLSEA